jgi:hypothetical protein
MILATCLATLACPAAADVFLRCSLDQKSGNGNWIPTETVLASTDAGVIVYDPLIAYFVGEPIAAVVATDNSRRSTYTWEVRVKDGANRTARMRFRLTVQKSSLAASITAQALGYVGPFTAGGQCAAFEP